MYYKTLSAPVSFLVLLSISCTPATAPDPVNVLFIAVDDMNVDLGSYGHNLVHSPNIDRLSEMGTRFDRAYTQYPWCGPSRASMLMGLRPKTTGHITLNRYVREYSPDVVTLPQMFRQNGYFSARIGKIFHYGNPTQIGTDGYDDPPSWDYTFNPRGRDKDEEHLLIDYTPERGVGSSLNWMMAEGADEEQTDGIGATEAIRLLEERQDRPFFLAVGFYRPHCPFIAPKSYFDRYPIESIRLPEEPEDDMADIPEIALWTNPLYWGLDEDQRRHTIRAYYAAISFVDAQIGRILDTLDRLDLWKNTIVVFWSDHGYLLSEHGQWMKRSLFEPSARAPFIIVAPGQRQKGQASQRIVEYVDIYPTLADLAGLQPPDNLEGTSLRPLLDNPEAAWDRPAYTEVRRQGRPGYSVRTERWRYNEWDGGEAGVELYDHDNDPHEFVNLASDPDYAGFVDELSALISRHWE